MSTPAVETSVDRPEAVVSVGSVKYYSDGRTDCGYSSQGGSPADKVQPDPIRDRVPAFLFPLSAQLHKRKTPFFDLAPKSSDTDRFMAIRPQFERLLLEHVRKSQKKGQTHLPMSTRLVMMGSTKEDASPEIVILCHATQKSAIKKFAKKEIITSICQASDSEANPFGITVIGQAASL
jgi:hypothetical protein